MSKTFYTLIIFCNKKCVLTQSVSFYCRSSMSNSSRKNRLKDPFYIYSIPAVMRPTLIPLLTGYLLAQQQRTKCYEQNGMIDRLIDLRLIRCRQTATATSYNDLH